MNEFDDTELFQQERYKTSPITQAIIDRFRQLAEGETVSFQELSELAHTRIRAGTNYYQSAVKIVLRDYGIVVTRLSEDFAVRVQNSEISKLATNTHLRRLKGSTKKLAARVDAVDVSKLDRDGVNRYVQAQTYAAMTETLISKKTQKEIEQRVASNPLNGIDKEETMKLLAGLWKPKQ